MKGKRGTDHVWHLRKYFGDAAIYARCECGHYYNCGRDNQDQEGLWRLIQIPTIFYPYCPCCGARKKRYSTEIEKVDYHTCEEKKYGCVYDMSGYFRQKEGRCGN